MMVAKVRGQLQGGNRAGFMPKTPPKVAVSGFWHEICRPNRSR
jgi:hypothetical protein